jgi:hypothetical protein
MESSRGAGAVRLNGGAKAERCLSHPVALRSRYLFSLRPSGAARPFPRCQEERGCRVKGSASLPEVRQPSSPLLAAAALVLLQSWRRTCVLDRVRVWVYLSAHVVSGTAIRIP